MRLYRNLIFSIIFIMALIFIYMNAEKIYIYFYSLISKKEEIEIPDSNEYKRKYDYRRYSNQEDFIPHSKKDIENIFYNILNNGWESFVFYCPSEYEECINDVEEISGDSTLVSNISGYISPFNSYTVINTIPSSYGEVYVKVEKKYDEDEIKQINNKLDLIYNELGLNNYNNEEKVKKFHDYLIKNVVYDEVFAKTQKSQYQPTKAVGALIEGYAVCGGYADSMAIFLDYVNIPNISLSSKTHTWNLVYINDEWLHIDSTWNDDAENERSDYEFYLIDTEQLMKLDTKEHTFPTNFFVEASKI